MQIEDAAFNLEAEILDACNVQFGVAEGTAFIKGNGVGKPTGITSVAIGSQTCADSTNHTLQAKDLMLALQKLKEPYQLNATFLIKSQALGRIRTEVGTTGQYVWGPLAEGKPPTILGRPYYGALDLDDDGTVTKIPAIVGDFKRGYRR
jgi:HK97 family phage major capsid protein